MSDLTLKENNDYRRSEETEKATENQEKDHEESKSRSESRGRYSDDDNNKSSKETEKPRYNNKFNEYRPDKKDYCCCNKCLGNKDKRDCACLIPSSKRRSNIGREGCRMCGCRGCHPEDKSRGRKGSRSHSSSYHHSHRKSRHSDSRSYSRSRSRSSSYHRSGHKRSYRSRSRSFSNHKLNDRDLKNGCCKKCMKAFAGRACACQVPSAHRKTDLTKNGCYHCGCKGCSPADLKD